jgi:hypothetical protein
MCWGNSRRALLKWRTNRVRYKNISQKMPKIMSGWPKSAPMPRANRIAWNFRRASFFLYQRAALPCIERGIYPDAPHRIPTLMCLFKFYTKIPGRQSKLALMARLSSFVMRHLKSKTFPYHPQSIVDRPPSLYIFSKIPIAFFIRSNTFPLPITSMDSNNGGLTFCPVTATRMIPKT